MQRFEHNVVVTKKQNKIIIFLHTIIIILLYTSPFWLSWKLIALLIVLNYTQVLIFGGCVLTILQFNSTEMSFQEWLWSHLGLNINRRKFNRFLMWQLPFILLAVALAWQQLLSFKPLVHL